MDNNFNQQVPQNQQPVYQQQAPVYQQPVYQQAPVQPQKFNMTELIGFILAATGTVLAILGSILTCSCSASKAFDASEMVSSMMGMFTGGSVDMDMHKMSLVWLLAVLGAVVAAVGVVLAIMSLKQKNAAVKAGKLAYMAIAVGAFGVIYGILPVLTICGYNCSLNSSYEDSMGSAMDSLGSLFQ